MRDELTIGPVTFEWDEGVDEFFVVIGEQTRAMVECSPEDWAAFEAAAPRDAA